MGAISENGLLLVGNGTFPPHSVAKIFRLLLCVLAIYNMC